MRLSTLTLEVQFRQWLEHVEVSRQFNIIRVGEYKKHVRLFSKMNYFQQVTLKGLRIPDSGFRIPDSYLPQTLQKHGGQ